MAICTPNTWAVWPSRKLPSGVVPGDIALLKLGLKAHPEEVEALRDELGLKAPLHEQYFS